MKITFPNGVVVETTYAELAEAHSAIKAGDEMLKTALGKNAVSLWDYVMSAFGIK